MGKKITSVFLMLVLLLIMVPTSSVEVEAASNDVYFIYGIDDYERNTIKIMGYEGELSPGQDLIIPSEIDGYTVTSVVGEYGSKYVNYGRFVLPDTVEFIDICVHGFTGTLEIPENVTQVGYDGSGLCCYGPDTLIYNPSLESSMAGEGRMEHDGYKDAPLHTLILGDNVKHYQIFSIYYPNLRKVIVSDSVTFLSGGGAGMSPYTYKTNGYKTHYAEDNEVIFYLKKFDSPVTVRSDTNYYKLVETDEIIPERGLAIGLKGCKYCYTNENEDLPIETLFLDDVADFAIFREKPSGKQFETDVWGLYVGWSGTFYPCVSPLNTTDTSKIQWSSSNPDVATVVDGVVTAHKIGKTTITASIAGLSISEDVYVRNMYVISSDDGVIADNLSGNMELPLDKIDAKETVKLELDATKLDPSDWTQWGQLKKILEDAYDKTITCSDAFDIEVNLKNKNSTWKVQPIDGKSISIWMPIEDLEDISDRRLIHLKDDGTYEELSFSEVSIDGVLGIRFETTSFSSFALVKESCKHEWDNGKVTKEATCKEPGLKIYTCTICKATKEETIAKLTTHTWDSGKVSAEATCTKAGTKTFTCVYCGTIKTEDIAATGHNHKTSVTKPTCTKQGYTTYTCSCGNSFVDDYTPATGHSYGEWNVEIGATCSEKGISRRYCACGHYETQDIAANGHTWDKGKVTKEATCKETGVKTYTCSVCNASKTEDISKLTIHTWNNGETTKKATCTENGEKKLTCTTCSQTKLENIAATGHDFDEWTQVTAPSATTKGLEERKCKTCGAREQREVDMLEGEATEPVPTEPAPTDPAPTEPVTTEPDPTDPAPTEPVTTEPDPTDPAPTEPAPTDPTPTEPAPTEPVDDETIATEPIPPADTEPTSEPSSGTAAKPEGTQGADFAKPSAPSDSLEEPSPKSPVWPIALIVILLIIAVPATIMLLKKKKAQS